MKDTKRRNEQVLSKIDRIESIVNSGCFDDALELNIRTYEEALADNNVELMAGCLYIFGVIEDNKAKPKRAMAFYKKATHIARTYKLNDVLVKTLNRRGNSYSLTGDLYSAIAKYREALSVVSETANPVVLRGKILNNLGILYIEAEDFESAEHNFYECVELAKEHGNQIFLSTAYVNLAEIYIKKKMYEEAMHYTRLSESVSMDTSDIVGEAIALSNRAVIMNRRKEEWEKVNQLFNQALEKLIDILNEIDKNDIRLKYGKEAFWSGQIDLAESILTELADDACEKTYYSIEVHALEVLEKLYEQKNDYKKAFQVAKRLHENMERSYSQFTNISLENVNREVDHSLDYAEVDNLQKSIKTLKLLSEIGQMITSCEAYEEIYEVLAENAKRVFSCDAFGIGIVEEQENKVVYRYIDETNILNQLKIPADDLDYFMTNCIHAGKDIIVYDTKDNVYNSAHFTLELRKIIEQSVNRTIIFCPVRFENHTIGGLTIQAKEKGHLSYVDLESLRVIASFVAIAYTNLKRAEELVIANKKLAEVSLKDGLTGVLNRYALGLYMEKSFKTDRLPAAALMIDLDYFKQYNDNYGHIMGDACLIKICDSLRNSLEDFQYKLFRYGGDEFFVIIEHCRKEEGILLINQIMDAMRELNIEHIYSKIENRVSLTIGACFIENPVDDFSVVFTYADDALYEAKGAGRNTYSYRLAH